jgi:hypothetical protein
MLVYRRPYDVLAKENVACIPYLGDVCGLGVDTILMVCESQFGENTPQKRTMYLSMSRNFDMLPV